MLAVVLAILAKLAVILKLGLWSISKRIASIIFLNIYTPPQHALTHNSLCFKMIDKANSKFDSKIKEALHINWKKPNLNARQNHLALTLSLCFCFLLFFSIFIFYFCVSLSSIVFIIYANHWHLLLSWLTLLLRHLFVTHLVIIVYNIYVINVCPRQLLWFI